MKIASLAGAESPVDGFHCRFRVTVAGSRALGGGLVKLGQVLRGQHKIKGCHVFFQVHTAGGAGDGDNPLALRQYPGQRKL